MLLRIFLASYLALAGAACEIVLTVDANGKASDPAIFHCATQALQTAAVDSLLASEFEPGMANGAKVPVRALVHLECGDSADGKYSDMTFCPS